MKTYSRKDLDNISKRIKRKRHLRRAWNVGVSIASVAISIATLITLYKYTERVDAMVVNYAQMQGQIETLQTQPEAQETPLAEPLVSEPPKPPANGTYRVISAYTSRVEETDSTPCIAADGSDICKRHEAGQSVCASNAFPLGTHITIFRKDGSPYWSCSVADRMNSRYPNAVDIYFGMDTQAALQFGRQTLYVVKN